MSRSSARLADGKRPPSPERTAAARHKRPRQLTKVELELGDGRYLLAYGYRATVTADA
ncbi:MAG: hypothetical protein ACYDA0_01470 [Candidatus Dormibacteraceae bacterium]